MAKEPKRVNAFDEREWTKRRAAELIVENMEDEAEAIGGYLPLIACLEEGGYKKAAALIREVVSDEKNHMLILQGLLQEFDGNIPVADDNVQGALQKIKKAIAPDGEVK